jgi:hypothetical protein
MKDRQQNDNNKDKKINNNLQNITQKTKDWATWTPLKPVVNSGAPEEFSAPVHMYNPLCYSYYKPSDKTWMRKGPDCDYDKRNTSVACE